MSAITSNLAILYKKVWKGCYPWTKTLVVKIAIICETIREMDTRQRQKVSVTEFARKSSVQTLASKLSLKGLKLQHLIFYGCTACVVCTTHAGKRFPN